MSTGPDISRSFADFRSVAVRYCNVVDSAGTLQRATLLLQIYEILPQLIQRAIALPWIELSDEDEKRLEKERVTQEEWRKLCDLLNEKLGDWNLYWEIFDPTKESEAICSTLADAIADIYRDIKGGLAYAGPSPADQNDIVWQWRFSYYSHWGHHAIDALRTIHALLDTIYEADNRDLF